VRDNLLMLLGVEPEELREAAKRELMLPWAGGFPPMGHN
jgi:hypothetical protein